MIVSNQPKNINDLEKIGVSKHTIARYGEAIINIITKKVPKRDSNS